MKENYKRIPFDLGIASKLLNEGGEDAIITRCGYKVRMYTTEGMSGNYPIIGEFQDSDGAIVTARWMNSGSYNGEPNCDYDLMLEVPDDKQEECTLKPFDKVVVRCGDYSWHVDFFSSKNEEYKIYICVGGNWTKCLPYTEETAKLIGTCNNWFGNPDGTLKE